MAPAELEEIIKPIHETFRQEDYPQLLVGLKNADDAAVYQINDQQAIISTTDFFPPVVDDPYDFGAIAAANALSDIYAMGGQALFAINLVAFPDNLGSDILQEILRGGAEKVAEAGAIVVGGHSVNDKEPKYGLAVTGIIDPQKVLLKGGAQAGDKLFLTKALGVGVITTALKRQEAEDSHLISAVESMKRLNNHASQAAQHAKASGMTDITGFGLLGHGKEMAEQAGVNFHFFLDRLPWLPGAIEYGKASIFPGGMGNNTRFFTDYVSFDDDVETFIKDLLFTPETSGGLLVAVPPENADKFVAYEETAVEIGRVTSGSGHIYVSTYERE